MSNRLVFLLLAHLFEVQTTGSQQSIVYNGVILSRVLNDHYTVELYGKHQVNKEYYFICKNFKTK